MRTTPLVAEKKEKSRMRLAERYYGKKDILASWEQRSLMSTPKNGRVEHMDLVYLRDLSRRIRGHYLDLTYRGMDGFNETNGDNAADL
jgi:hypothetical protein